MELIGANIFLFLSGIPLDKESKNKITESFENANQKTKCVPCARLRALSCHARVCASFDRTDIRTDT